jgi:hypothetical protein
VVDKYVEYRLILTYPLNVNRLQKYNLKKMTNLDTQLELRFEFGLPYISFLYHVMVFTFFANNSKYITPKIL